MSELATLGTRYISEGAAEAHRDLDQFAAKARVAEQASDTAAGGTRRLSASMSEMVEAVQRAEREMAEVAQQERIVAQAAEAAAIATGNLGRAAAQASPAISKAGKDIQAAAVGFDSFYEVAQRDFATQYSRQLTTVAGAHGKTAATSKQLSLATLDLSRQFADIGVTAAMGMNPLMILIQQGPQIADRLAQMKMEGVGVGGAFKSMAASAGPLLIGGGLFAVGAGVVLGLAAAFVTARKEAADFQNALTSTGNYAGLTADSYRDMAERIANATDTSVRSNEKSITSLVQTGRYSADTIELMVDVSQRYAKLTGQSTDEVLKGYVGMADGVTKWAAKHALVHHDLTVMQLDRINQLEKAGKAEEAYQLALGNIQQTVENRVAPAFGLVERILDGVRKKASATWDAILGFDRPSTNDQEIAKLQAAIKELELPKNADSAQAQRALVRNRANLREAFAERDELNSKAAADAAKAQDEAVKINDKYGSGGSAYKAPKSQRFDQSEQAIEQATKTELAARQALTKNIEQTAAFRRQEIDSELAIQRVRLERAVHEKSITKSAQAEAMAKYEEAAREEKLLADRQEAADLAQRDLEQRKAILADQDRLAKFAMDNANTAAEAGVIEKQALEVRQTLERDQLAERTKQQVIWGEITEEARKALIASQADVQAAEDVAQAREANARVIREQTALREAELDVQRAALDAQAMLSRSSYGRAVIGRDLLDVDHENQRLKAEEAVRLAKEGSEAQREAQLRLQALTARQAAEKQLVDRDRQLVNAVTEAADATRGFGSALRRHDWVRAFDELQRTIEVVQMSFQNNGMTGGMMTLGSVAAQAIGGKTGAAIGGGLGIAGMGIAAGSSLMTAASMGMLGSGIGAGLGMTIAPLLGPIGLAAGALYAAAKLLNVGGKPSNAGAGVDLVTGAITGNRRTDETEQAAKSAADAIKGIEESLKAAGIGLEDSVRGLVLGTRDQTQIYLQSGKTLTSAVGDSGAAVDVALRALLDGADYVSEAQEKLVRSALDAGKGFDEISQILASYEAAQAITGNLADQILRLTDPKAYDTEAVKRGADEQRKAAQAAADAGYITADQLAEINKQLATLQGLQLDDVMKRYGATNDSVMDQTRDALLDTYQAFSQAKEAEVSALRQTADALRSFRQQLDFGAIAGRDPVSQYIATKREFDRLNTLGADDPDRVANLQVVGQAFLEASRAASPTQQAFERDLSAVRRATEASQDMATQQADVAQAQLDAYTAQLQQLGLLNTTATSVAGSTAAMAAALQAYLAAVASDTAVASPLGGASNDNLDVAKYLAANPDLAMNWNSGGWLRSAGATLEDAARVHYANNGKAEIAAGTRMRGYAAGGDHPGGLRLVGEHGPEIEATGPSRIFSASQTAQMLGGENSEIVAELRSLREEVRKLREQESDDNRDIKRNTKDSADILAKVTQGQDKIRTVAA